MEKILVLSDIHGAPAKAVRVVRSHPDCQTVIFLGDGARQLDLLRKAAPNAAFLCVRGNCDTFLDGIDEEEMTFSCADHRIFICHGHTRFVKHGMGALLAAAQHAHADIALFGHTHVPHEEYDSESGIYLFNPGSIGAPRDGRFTYGILTLDARNVLFSIGEAAED